MNYLFFNPGRDPPTLPTLRVVLAGRPQTFTVGNLLHSNAFILLLHSEPLCIKFYVASDPQRKAELYYDKCMSSEMLYTVFTVVKLQVNDVFIS